MTSPKIDEEALTFAVAQTMSDRDEVMYPTICARIISAYLQARAEQGFREMPRDPTDTMHREGMSTRQMQDNLNKAHHVVIDTSDVWRAMFDAHAKDSQ